MDMDFGPLDFALEKSRKLKADQADAFFQNEVGLSIKVFGGKVEKFAFSEDRGLGVRVFLGNREGRAYTTELSRDSISDLVETALANAKVTPPDPARFIPEPGLYPSGATEGARLGEDLGIFGADLSQTPTAGKIDFALDLERLARSHDPRIKGVESVAYQESSGTLALASTPGFRASFRSSICFGYLIAIASENGESQTGFGFTAGRSFRDLDCEGASREAASKAIDMLGGRQVETARVPVLFDNLSSAELVAVIGAALSGEAVVKGRSFLSGKLGERIAPDYLLLLDDGLLEGGFGTGPFDAEGVATSRKPVIEDGVLKTFLHNCFTGARAGVASTGNAGRASFRSKVGVSPTNLVITPGEATPEQMRSGIERGLEIVELQGVHVGLNPITGEVSVGAKGRWIEGGQPAFPVREITIAGKIEDILEGVVQLGNDIRYAPLLGGVGAPSILVEGLVISGK